MRGLLFSEVKTKYTMKRFREDVSQKFRFIDKNPNLKEWQMNMIKQFFDEHPEQTNFIKNWNTNIPYETYYSIMDNYYNANTPKEGLDSLSKDDDYVYLGEDIRYYYYAILSYKASVVFASNNVGKKVWCETPDWYHKDNIRDDYPFNFEKTYLDDEYIYGGAKWCISMNHTDRYWRDYTQDKSLCFIFAIEKEDYDSDNPRRYKLAISINKDEFPSMDCFDVYYTDDGRTYIDDDIYDFIGGEEDLIAEIFDIHVYPESEEFDDTFDWYKDDAYYDYEDHEIVNQYVKWCDCPLDSDCCINIYEECKRQNYSVDGFINYMKSCIKDYFDTIGKSYLPKIKSKSDLIDYVFDLKHGYFEDLHIPDENKLYNLLAFVLRTKHDTELTKSCLFKPLIDKGFAESEVRHSFTNFVKIVESTDSIDELITNIKESSLAEDVIDKELIVSLAENVRFSNKEFVSLDNKHFFIRRKGWKFVY